jgi:hypothetical protein
MSKMMNKRPRHHIGKLILAQVLTTRQIMRILDHKLSHYKYFTFNGQQLAYFFHSYNCFRVNERAVEVPIIKYYLDQGNYQNVLEIGNVTNYYYDYFRQSFVKKTVVDKGEQGYGVLTMDIADYIAPEPFDFVFSISTFEHMDSDRGRNPDYVPGQSELISYAADNIRHVGRNLLAEGGKFVLTAPLGYAQEWDETIFSNAFDQCGFTNYRVAVLRRLTELTWEQTQLAEVDRRAFDYSTTLVNYVSVVEFVK